MQKLTREEMKNITANSEFGPSIKEQGRSLKKKNLQLEYPFLMLKKGCEWMFYNLHWVILSGCVILGLMAWWGISTGVLR